MSPWGPIKSCCKTKEGVSNSHRGADLAFCWDNQKKHSNAQWLRVQIFNESCTKGVTLLPRPPWETWIFSSSLVQKRLRAIFLFCEKENEGNNNNNNSNKDLYSLCKSFGCSSCFHMELAPMCPRTSSLPISDMVLKSGFASLQGITVGDSAVHGLSANIHRINKSGGQAREASEKVCFPPTQDLGA